MNVIKILIIAWFMSISMALIARVTLHQNDIELQIEKWYAFSFSSFNDERLPFSMRSLAGQHVKPLQITVTNRGLTPVLISRESLKISRVSPEFLLSKAQEFNGDFRTAYFLILIVMLNGLRFEVSMLQHARWENDWARRRAGLPRLLQINKLPWIFPLWGFCSLAAVMCYQFLFQDPVTKVALQTQMLGDDVLIAPGQSVRKLVFLDSKPYNGLFTFRVWSEDKKDYAAFFDVELVR